MEKQLGTAGEIVKAQASGGFQQYKEAVYNILGNFFTWLSTHQGLALIMGLGILIIIIYLIVRSKSYRKKLETNATTHKTEIGKKDTLIEEQKSKLAALQKKLADQQNVVSQALLGTLMNLTGYDLDQLRIFVKFLTKVDGNPLQSEDTQVIAIPESQGLEEDSHASVEENDEDEKMAPEAAVEADKSGKE